MPANGSSSDSPAPASFEEAFSRLEQTVQALEQGNLSLEEATRLYEEGMDLARLCNKLLSVTEIKVTKLRNSYLAGGGTPEAEDAQD